MITFLKILKSGYSLTILKKLKRFGVLKVWLPVIQRCLSKGSPLYNVLEAIDSAILSGKNELYDDHILGLVSLLCFAIDEKDSYFNTANLQNKQLYLFSEFGVFQKKRFALVIYQAAVFMCAPELFISVEGKNLFKVMRGELGGQVVETLRYLSEAKIIKPSAFHYWEDYMNSLKRPKSFRRKKRH